MSAPGLTQRLRPALALFVVVSLAVGAATVGPWQAWADSLRASETAPQLVADTIPSDPAVADGTRKSPADSLNLLPKSALLVHPGRLSPDEDDTLPMHDRASSCPGGAGYAAAASRAPPDQA